MFRVLMIDNDITHANLTARGIQDLRFGVTMKYALSAAQGLLYLAGSRSGKKALPDLIILSTELPDADGVDAFGTFREAVAHDGIPIVVASKLADRKIAAEYYKLGAAAYIPYSECVEDYMKAVGDSVAFVAMLAGLVPRQQQFFPPENRKDLSVGDVLQVHL